MLPRTRKTMSIPESTCWTVIRAAAAGSPTDCEELARRYFGVVGVYLAARWHDSSLHNEIDDARQEVFVECFRAGGVLEAAATGRVPSFRAFLFGVIRNVARRFESRRPPAAGPLPEIVGDDASLSHLFDRTWAHAIMAEAAQLQRTRATVCGAEAVQRVELLRLRFEESLPIRAIAERWGIDAARLHQSYALARQEFRAALLAVLAFHQPGSPAEVEQEAADLLRALA
jgi:RNA polymerase sigma-70 factor (ECF subfamily)